MTDNIVIDQEPQAAPLYSKTAVMAGTFIGGPLVSGILFRRNFINLGKPKEGNYALYISIAVTLFIMVGMLGLNEEVTDKMPKFLIPAIYMGITFSMFNKYFKDATEAHAKSGGAFYSGWRVAGATAIGFAVMAGGVVAYVLTADHISSNRYEALTNEFQANETEALKLYDIPDTSSVRMMKFIRNTANPKWERNLAVVAEMDQVQGLTELGVKQNRILREYCNLRINLNNAIMKNLAGNTHAYDDEIDALANKIATKLDELGPGE